MEDYAKSLIYSFDQVFKNFDVTNEAAYVAGIDWYNSNILIIGLCVSCPVPVISVPSKNSYQWVYSCGLIACANIKARWNLNLPQNSAPESLKEMMPWLI